MRRINSTKSQQKKSKRKKYIRKPLPAKNQQDAVLSKMMGDLSLFLRRCSYAKKTIRGRKTKYTPEQLYNGIIEYIHFVDTTPFYERKIAGTYYGEPMLVDLPKKRPMTIDGLILFLNISSNTWYEIYSKRPEFMPIVEMAEMIIKDQKYSGAATGFFKESIIIRDLGLKERNDVTSNDKDIPANNVIILPAKEILE